MIKQKNPNVICITVIALLLFIMTGCMNDKSNNNTTIVGNITENTETIKNVDTVAQTLDYETRLFDTSRVHTINIVIDDWDAFLSTCTSEEYSPCDIYIDDELIENAGIRGKGNSSLSSVAAYGNDRYSFKVEFDQYTKGNNYYGLDKISLNNIIQDNTYMKDYLTYVMMNEIGIASPLCSFVYITVNGEEWGLYLAVECVEEGFLERNYGSDDGELYKPDSMDMGGGRGNGQDFNMDDILAQFGADDISDLQDIFESGEFTLPNNGDFTMPDMGEFIPPTGDNIQDTPENRQIPEGGLIFDRNNMRGGGFGGISSADVMLQYIDDNPDSYTNIFDNAKTKVSEDDEARLIQSLKTLSEGMDIESVVDIESVIKYFVVHNFVLNGDSYTGSMIHNYYLYEENGVLSMIPWDYNLAFGAFNMRGSGASGATATINSPIDSPVTSGTIESRPMLAWIFANEEYTEMYHKYFGEFIETFFDSGYFAQMYDEVIALISPYVEKDPTKFCTYDEFVKGASTLREFCLLRTESINGQLNGTIPSTQEGQTADSSSFIDASHINISDTGSMGGMIQIERNTDGIMRFERGR